MRDLEFCPSRDLPRVILCLTLVILINVSCTRKEPGRASVSRSFVVKPFEGSNDKPVEAVHKYDNSVFYSTSNGEVRRVGQKARVGHKQGKTFLKFAEAWSTLWVGGKAGLFKIVEESNGLEGESDQTALFKMKPCLSGAVYDLVEFSDRLCLAHEDAVRCYQDYESLCSENSDDDDRTDNGSNVVEHPGVFRRLISHDEGLFRRSSDPDGAANLIAVSATEVLFLGWGGEEVRRFDLELLKETDKRSYQQVWIRAFKDHIWVWTEENVQGGSGASSSTEPTKAGPIYRISSDLANGSEVKANVSLRSPTDKGVRVIADIGGKPWFGTSGGWVYRSLPGDGGTGLVNVGAMVEEIHQVSETEVWIFTPTGVYQATSDAEGEKIDAAKKLVVTPLLLPGTATFSVPLRFLHASAKDPMGVRLLWGQSGLYAHVEGHDIGFRTNALMRVGAVQLLWAERLEISRIGYVRGNESAKLPLQELQKSPDGFEISAKLKSNGMYGNWTADLHESGYMSYSCFRGDLFPIPFGKVKLRARNMYGSPSRVRELFVFRVAVIDLTLLIFLLTLGWGFITTILFFTLFRRFKWVREISGSSLPAKLRGNWFLSLFYPLLLRSRWVENELLSIYREKIESDQQGQGQASETRSAEGNFMRIVDHIVSGGSGLVTSESDPQAERKLNHIIRELPAKMLGCQLTNRRSWIPVEVYVDGVENIEKSAITVFRDLSEVKHEGMIRWFLKRPNFLVILNVPKSAHGDDLWARVWAYCRSRERKRAPFLVFCSGPYDKDPRIRSQQLDRFNIQADEDET